MGSKFFSIGQGDERIDLAPDSIIAIERKPYGMIIHLLSGQSITLLPSQRKALEEYLAKKFKFDVGMA